MNALCCSRCALLAACCTQVCLIILNTNPLGTLDTLLLRHLRLLLVEAQSSDVAVGADETKKKYGFKNGSFYIIDN